MDFIFGCSKLLPFDGDPLGPTMKSALVACAVLGRACKGRVGDYRRQGGKRGGFRIASPLPGCVPGIWLLLNASWKLENDCVMTLGGPPPVDRKMPDRTFGRNRWCVLFRTLQ